VTVIIRRPHAYRFLVEQFAEGVARDEIDGSEAGLRIRGEDFVIPGFYVLDARGKLLGKSGLGSADAVLECLRAHARP
jgi:hypothetical protein